MPKLRTVYSEAQHVAAARQRVGRALVRSIVLGGLVAAAHAQTDTTFSVELTSAAVGPTTADPDGSGIADITASIEQREFCYELTVEDIAPPSAAHLHQGAQGRMGPVMIKLEAPADGASNGCVRADPDLLAAIIENPSLYYIDVHNSEYPGAALRGQLGTDL